MCCDVFINHEDTKNFSGVRTQESGVRRKGRDFFHHEEIEGHEGRRFAEVAMQHPFGSDCYSLIEASFYRLCRICSGQLPSSRCYDAT